MGVMVWSFQMLLTGGPELLGVYSSARSIDNGAIRWPTFDKDRYFL